MFCFSVSGFVPRRWHRFWQNGWQMSATLRDRSRASELAQKNIAPLFLDTDREMDTYSHILVSAPSARDGSDCF